MNGTNKITELLNKVSDYPTILCTREGEITSCNESAQNILGNGEEIIGKNVSGIFSNTLDKKFLEEILDKGSTDTSVSISQSGEKEVKVQLNLHPLEAGDEEGEIVITAKNYFKEEELRDIKGIKDYDKQLEVLFDNALVGLIAYTNDKIDFVNKRILEITGYSRNEIIGSDLTEFIPDASDRFSFKEKLQKIQNNQKTPSSFAIKLETKDGNYIYAEVNVGLISNDPPRFLALLVDVSEKIFMQKKVDMIVEKMSDGLIMHEEGNIKFANSATYNMTNFEANELQGKNLFDINFDEASKKKIKEKISETQKKGFSETTPYSVKIIKEEGDETEEKNIQINSGVLSLYPYQAVIVMRDLTKRVKLKKEKKKAQQQLWQTGKLASLGELSAGVAHEVNNPLMGIISYAQLILENFDKDSENYEYTRAILDEADRISQLVRNLLTFSRQNQEEKKATDVNEIIEAALSLTEFRLEKDGITIKKDFDDSSPLVLSRSSQLEEVFINIISNAHHALNEKFQGFDEDKVLNIITETIEEDDQTYVKIVFEDKGAGIGEKEKDQIFDAFFTTKDEEKGTGLGLSISQGIIKDHDGEIKVESSKGKYTKFKVLLPPYEE